MTRRGPSRWAEGLVALLVPPACREEVVGDLHERYRSAAGYALEAVRTVPLVILSRMRRTGDPRDLVVQGFALYLSFLAAAWIPSPALLGERLGLLRLALPAAMMLLGLVLDDTYRKPGPRAAWSVLRGPVVGAALAVGSQRILAAGDAGLALPERVLLYGCGLGLLFGSAIRLWFPPRAEGVVGQRFAGASPGPVGAAPRGTVALFCALLICGATVLSMATRQEERTFSYPEFLERLRKGEVAAVELDAARSGEIEATLRFKDGGSARTVLPWSYGEAVEAMRQSLVSVEVREGSMGWRQIVVRSAPFLTLLAVWIVMVLGRRGGHWLGG
ncbi:MAG: hypothetical protein KGN36_05635 [Acidobacteriota bacterium]|nr:hypothetical protein [Acidobacteriota bacterium]